MEAQGSPPGWHDDPWGADVLRWWDGAEWTAHTHPKTAEPAAAEASAPAAAAPAAATTTAVAATPKLARSAPPWPWIAGIAALVAIVVVIVIVTGGDGVAPQDDPAADAKAISTAVTAQSAIETFAVDQNGRYSGATNAGLKEIVPTLERKRITIDAGADTYTLSIASASGNSFVVTKADDGTVSYSCSEAGVGGCPASGVWVPG